MNSLEHEKYIRRTLEIAAQAVRDGDHPFGALMVLDGEVVSSSGNRARIDSDYTAHAEILVVADATGKLTPSELLLIN